MLKLTEALGSGKNLPCTLLGVQRVISGTLSSSSFILNSSNILREKRRIKNYKNGCVFVVGTLLVDWEQWTVVARWGQRVQVEVKK